jgi:hypothetical protein
MRISPLSVSPSCQKNVCLLVGLYGARHDITTRLRHYSPLPVAAVAVVNEERSRQIQRECQKSEISDNVVDDNDDVDGMVLMMMSLPSTIDETREYYG